MRAAAVEHTVVWHGKRLQVTLSGAAQRALRGRDAPLLVEMELYFSCLIRTAVRFREAGAGEGVPVAEGLRVAFRAAMTRACEVSAAGSQPPATDFPIVRVAPYLPRWLHVDVRRGHWKGEFGYGAPLRKASS